MHNCRKLALCFLANVFCALHHSLIASWLSARGKFSEASIITIKRFLFARAVMEKGLFLCGHLVMEVKKGTPVLRMVIHPVSTPLALAQLPVMEHRRPTMSSVLEKWQWLL